MASVLVVCYDNSTGRYLAQRVGSAQIADGAVLSGKIGSGQVASGHLTAALIASIEAGIADESVTSAKLASGAVIGNRIADAGIFSGKIASGAIGPSALLANAIIISAKIASGIVGTVHLRNGAVTSAKIASGFTTPPGDESITSAKLASGAVVGDRVAVDGIVSSHIGADVVGGIHILAGAIVSAKIGANVIGTPHLERFASGKVIAGQGTGTNPILKDHQAAIEFVVDGGGAVITSGIQGKLNVVFPATLNEVRLLADRSGYISLDIWKTTYANYESLAAANSICSASKPLISSLMKYEDTDLTGWNKTIASGDILAYIVDSAVSSIQRCTISLGVYK